MKPGRALLGLILIGLGTLFLLDRAGILDAGEVIADWWPVVLIAVGLIQLTERPHSIVGPLIVVAVGVILLLITTDVVEGNVWDYVWPAVLIVIGVAVIARRGGSLPRGPAGEDVVRATGIFGGPEIASTSQRFKGASLTAIFGGVTLDVRHARPDPEGATVTATAAFGGIDIIVPRGWRVTVRGTPIFGGLNDKTERVGDLSEDPPTLVIDAVAIFGGVEVKHDK